ncbi:MAG: transposase [Candidatus Omnitrophota bacterium]
MGRYARVTYPELTYHVINRGNNREVVFAEEEDYYHYLNTLQRYKKKFGFKLFAYCLMTNNVHLLIKVSEQASISKIMQCITVAHIRQYNFKYRRCGHVWQGRFNSPLVSEDDHLLNVMRYIEQNPLRAKMVKRMDEYRWSSYRLNIKEENVCYQKLGDHEKSRINAYKEFVNVNLTPNEIQHLHKSTRNGSDYISKRFQDQIMELLPKKRKRGRPRNRDLNLV